MKSLNQFNAKATDWRAQISRNNRRTYFVMTMFVLIYVVLGVLIDAYLMIEQHPGLSVSEALQALITFQVVPWATIITFIVAVVSIQLTLIFHQKLMLLGTEYHEITADTAQTTAEKQLYNVVEELKIAAGLNYMPRVYIIDADYMNAFASGFSEKSAMVAITRGLMEKLTRAELQAVMAHEMSHIRNMDIKLTLIASLLANLMIIVLDVMFYNLMYGRRSNNSKGNGLALVLILVRYILPLLNIILLLYLSRTREYLADAGCVELTRENEPLASALLKINQDYQDNATAHAAQAKETPHENIRREAYIFDPYQAGISNLGSASDFFSTHPSLKARLAALGFTDKT